MHNLKLAKIFFRKDFIKLKLNYKIDFIVIGLALFAMFFGAGNLIFPPSIGILAGSSWKEAFLGFFLTGIGLPLAGIIALNKAGSLENFSKVVSKKFSLIYTSLLVISIGPLLAIPRTGATTFELGILPAFPQANKYIVLTIYFALTLYFSIKPSKFIDSIGKILTPVILVLLAFLIIKGIFFLDLSQSIKSYEKNMFTFGFFQGYQTMDALASVIFTSIILSSLVSKGYKDKESQNKLLLLASIIASLGLTLVYGGLLYLGSRFSDTLPHSLDMAKLISIIAKAILGESSSIILGLAVSIACLTTSIGLSATVGHFFSKVTSISYEKLIIITCIFSAFISSFGVEFIVKFSVPILIILYPITIILIILHILGVENKNSFKYSVYSSLLISILQLGVSHLNLISFDKILNILPFYDSGFPWLMPFTFILIGTNYKYKVKNRT